MKALLLSSVVISARILTLSHNHKKRFGFTASSGYQTDGDAGLKLLGHRYYDPSTGRFLSRDAAKQGHNWYAYCQNNPVVRADSTGLVGQWVWNGFTWVWKIIGIITLIKGAVALPVALWESAQESGEEIKVKEAVAAAEAKGLSVETGNTIIGGTGGKLGIVTRHIARFWEFLTSVSY